MNIRQIQLGSVERVWLLVVTAVSCAFFSTISLAQDVILKSSIANWSIYCLRDVSEIKPQDCSLVTAAVGETDANDWIKVGITLSSPQEMEMTIRTPRLNYFKTGISITGEGTQLGRAFIDKCNDTSCQTTVAVDSRMLQGLATAKSLRFEYQISESEGVALAVNVEGTSKNSSRQVAANLPR
jgi:invasion protein IalB